MGDRPEPRPLASGTYAFRLGKGRETRRIEAVGEYCGLPSSVTLLVARIGEHRIAVEATRVIEVRAGEAFETDDPRRPVTRADLHALLGEPQSLSPQSVLARADRQTGRGDGPRVAFAADEIDRLVVVPLEGLAPLPPVAREQIQVDFLVGVAFLPPVKTAHEKRTEAEVRAERDGPPRLETSVERAAFLLDPRKLALAAANAGGRALG